MHNTVATARALAQTVVSGVADSRADVLLAPPFTALAAVAEVVGGSRVGLAAQDMHWADAGAFTGEVSPLMVRELAEAVIVGHSERRAHFDETDEWVRRKVDAALAHGLAPIVCVGETAEQRDGHQAEAMVMAQLNMALGDVEAGSAGRLVIAYEPVWAIGTGRACDPAEAQRMAGRIRALCAALWSDEVAATVRVLYGGSVTPTNAAELFAGPDIDGALVGGASLDAAAFGAIVGVADALAAHSVLADGPS
jgi:triosephosphate isomerase